MSVDGLQHKNLKKDLKTLLATPVGPGCGQRKRQGSSHQAAQLEDSFY